MKLLTLSLIAASTISLSALAQNPNGKTYRERYGFSRFSASELAQRERENEDYERNGELYEKLDELNDALDKIQAKLDD